MNEKEKAIVTAYTGITMLQGEGLNVFYKYLYELFGRPVYTHEIPHLAEEIKKRSRDDFIELCRKEEPEQRWIPVSERLPEEGHDVLITKESFKTKGYEQKVIKAKSSVDPRSGKIEWWSPEFGALTNKAVFAWMPLPEPYKEE